MLASLLMTVGLALLAIASPAPVDSEILGLRDSPKAQLITSCTKSKTAAITFDDGPYKYIYNISKQLVAANAKGTFFFNGDNWGCIYSDNIKRVKYAYSKGHQIASHTWAHKDLATLSYSQIKSEMVRLDQALQNILGIRPAFVRPPYGSYNDNVLKAAYSRKQKVVIWDFDSLDSDGATYQQSNSYYDEEIAKKPKSILALNHETYSKTAYHVVPHAIQALQKAGYKLVTLAECLGMDPYISVGKPGTPNSTWTC